MGPDRPAGLGRGWVGMALLLASAVGLTLAYPTTDWSSLAWVALVPLLTLALDRAPPEALGQGWLMGTAFFVLLLRWLDHTFRHYSAIPWPLTWLPIVGLSAYSGLYIGLVAALVSWLRRRLGGGWALAAAPFLWVAAEWIRGRILSGFPWGLLGYSQYRELPLIQIAEWTGVYGVSFVIVAVNAALAGIVALGWRRAAVGVTFGAALLAITGAVGVLRPGGGGSELRPPSMIPVAVIQPSIEQSLKWDPAFQVETLRIYTALTRRAGAGTPPSIVIWPETAAPIFLRRDPALVEMLRGLSAEVRAPLLVGSVDGDQAGLYNSAFLLTGRGLRAKYDKIHLVPFGEYLPLGGVIGFVRGWAEFISEFRAGRTPTVFTETGPPFGVVICYEGIFPDLFRRFVAGGAQYMANITNDAWFGTTSGPWQHLAMLPFRAVENRVAIARSANTGVSAFVEPDGRISNTLGPFERGVLNAVVPLRQRTTFYTRFGDLFAYACLGIAASGCGIVAFLRRTP